MINEDGVEIEHGMVVYEPWKGGYYLKSEADKVIADLEESHKMEKARYVLNCSVKLTFHEMSEEEFKELFNGKDKEAK